MDGGQAEIAVPNGTLNWGGLYLDDVTISGTSITETRASSSVMRRATIDGRGEGEDSQEVTKTSICLSDALVSARLRIVREDQERIEEFKLPLPVGTGFSLFKVDDEDRNGEIDGPSEGEEDIYQFLTVVFATKREMEPIRLEV